MRKRCMVVLLVLLLPAALFAGAQKEGGASAKGPITVVVRTLAHGLAAQAEVDIINKFNASQPQIKADIIQGQWTQFYAQLRLAAMAGEAPQLATSAFQKLPEMYEYYTPLDKSPYGNLFEATKLRQADFDAKGWEESFYQGTQYVVPGYYPGKMMWYSKDLFRKAGLDPEKFPDTSGPFVTAANKIKATGAYAFHPASDGPPRFWRRAWEVALWQQGGEMFDPGYTKATFNNEKGTKALQFIVDIIHKYGWNVVGGDGYKQFGAKQLGIIYGGNWFYANATASGVDWGAAKTTVFFDKRSTWLNGEGLVIPVQKKGTPKEVYVAAMEVAKFYVENCHIYTMGSGHISAFKPALARKELVESEYWQRAGIKLAEMIGAGEVHYPVKHTKGSELESAIETKIELAVGGMMSGPEALATAEAECNAILTK